MIYLILRDWGSQNALSLLISLYFLFLGFPYVWFNQL